MTTHKIIDGNSNDMKCIDSKSIDLIVTSPPYPMIAMWDNLFSEQDQSIVEDLSKGNAFNAFNKMHSILNKTWEECDRVLIDNGFVCINIGDATRTINGEFHLFTNHTAIINYFISKGYSLLPDIIWRKQSNSPNKFMGSGMYPAGAYVTYEHEYILIFRKGGKRIFKGKEKELRQSSAYFWEERNSWFSDLWEIKGTSQMIPSAQKNRERSAAFPFEIPYRLTNMYSVEGDTVLDPFAGLGTTNLACMASNRNSIGVEIDPEIAALALQNITVSADSLNNIIDSRIKRHLDFIETLPDDKREHCYKNGPHGFYVKTKQETAIKIDRVACVTQNGSVITCSYE
ncbi:DNA-methyltransferase [Caproiciproducens sp. R2]|uniref:DNA-methyltransferase n=1 Tax=Caproiciproducens sp. R2 TaxID=3435187 RepID=UPI0040347242